jgi:hypothetical protein
MSSKGNLLAPKCHWTWRRRRDSFSSHALTQSAVEGLIRVVVCGEHEDKVGTHLGIAASVTTNHNSVFSIVSIP